MGALAAEFARRLPSAAVSGRWRALTTLSSYYGSQVYGHAFTSDGTRCYFSQGYSGNSSGPVNQAGILLPDGTLVSIPNAPTARWYVASVFAGGKHLVLGGMSGSSNVTQATVEAYTPAGTNGASGAWTTLAAMPAALCLLGAATLGGFVYAAGGTTSNGGSSTGTVSTLYRYDLTANTWTSLANLPAGRYYLALVAYAGKLYALAGANSGGSGTNTIYVYDVATNSWSTSTSVIPLSGGSFYTATVVGQTAYAADTSGGLATWTIDLPTVGVAAGVALTTNHGSLPALAAVGASLFLSGGSSGNVVDALSITGVQEGAGSPTLYSRKLRALQSFLAANDPESYAVASRLPSTMPIAGWRDLGANLTATSGRACSTDGSLIYLTHGAAGTAGVTVNALGVNNALSNAAGTGRTAPAGAFANGRHHAIGGMNSGGTALATVDAYTPSGANGTAGSWTTVASVPQALTYASAVAIGTLVYLAGGSASNNPSTNLNTLYRLDTVANTWATLAALPAPRSHAALIVIGGVLYFMGGYDTNGAGTNTVYAYDPVANAWSTVPTARGLLAASYDLSAAVVGSVAVVQFAATAYTWTPAGGPGQSIPPLVNHQQAGGAAALGGSVYLLAGSNTGQVEAIDPISSPAYARDVALVKSLALAGPA